jgi:hypothetical protein
MYFQGPLESIHIDLCRCKYLQVGSPPYPVLGGISNPGHLVKEGDSVQRLLKFLTPGLCAWLCLLSIGCARNIHFYTGVFCPRLIRDMRA